MTTSFLKEGSAELHLRFAGSYIGIRNVDESVTPLYVRAITEVSKAKGTLNISGTIADAVREEWAPFNKVVPESSLDYFPPRPGLRNFPTQALHYDILPLRHRVRGLTRDMVRCNYITGLRDIENNLESVDFCLRIFNPSYINIHAAIELVRKKKMTSAAFSTKFAVARSKDYKGLYFVYKNKPIGIYSKENNSAVLPPISHYLSDSLSAYINCIKEKV